MAVVVEELALAFTTEGESDIEAALHQLTEAVEHLGETLHLIKPHSDQATNALKDVAAQTDKIGAGIDRLEPKHKKHIQTVKEVAEVAAHGRKVVGEGIEEMGVFTESIAKRMEHVGVTMAFTFASMANGGEAGLARLLHMGASLAFMFGAIPGIMATVGLAMGEGLFKYFTKEAEVAKKKEEGLVKSLEEWYKKLNEGPGSAFFEQSEAMQKEVIKTRTTFEELSQGTWMPHWEVVLKGWFAGAQAFFTGGMGTSGVHAFADALNEYLRKYQRDNEEKMKDQGRMMSEAYFEGLRQNAEEQMALTATRVGGLGTLVSTKRATGLTFDELRSISALEKARLSALKEGYHDLDKEIAEAQKKAEEARRRYEDTIKMLHFPLKREQDKEILQGAERDKTETENEVRSLQRKQAFQLKERADAAEEIKKINDLLMRRGADEYDWARKNEQNKEVIRKQAFQERLGQEKVESAEEFLDRLNQMAESHAKEDRLLDGRIAQAREIYKEDSNEYKELVNQKLLLDQNYEKDVRGLEWSHFQWEEGQIQRNHARYENVLHSKHLSTVEEAEAELAEADRVLASMKAHYMEDTAAYTQAVAAKQAAEKGAIAARLGALEQNLQNFITSQQLEVAIGNKMQFDADRARIAHAREARAALASMEGLTPEQRLAALNKILAEETILLAKHQAKITAAAQTLGQSIASGISTGIETVFSGGGLAAGFQKMLGALLSGLGDIAIRFGTESAAFMALMNTLMKAIASFDPEMGLAASFGMIALGATLKAAGSALGKGGGHGGGGGGGYTTTTGTFGGGIPQIGSIGPVSPAARGTASSAMLMPMQPIMVNATIIGKDDPSAQRNLLEMIARAQRRGSTSG